MNTNSLLISITITILSTGTLPAIAETIATLKLKPVQGLRSVVASEDNQISISPNGKWLIIREKISRQTSKPGKIQITVHNLIYGQTFRLNNNQSGSGFLEQGWTPDSMNYHVDSHPRYSISFNKARPALLPGYTPQGPLVSGGDPTIWRDRQGNKVPHKPFESGSIFQPDYAWSPNGKIYYSFRQTGSRYCLTARSGSAIRTLDCHDLTTIKKRFSKDLENSLARNFRNRPKPPGYTKMRNNIIRSLTPNILIPGYFSISPDGHYLYYQLKPGRGPGSFSVPDTYTIRRVIDLRSGSLRQWQIHQTVMYTVRWHPDSKRLFFVIQQQKPAQKNTRPPMSRPATWYIFYADFRANP